MDDYMNNQQVTAEELVVDESFNAWFRQSDPVQTSYWNNWIEKNPQWKAEVEKAVHLLKILELKDAGIQDAHTWEARDRLMDAASAKRKQRAPVFFLRSRYIWWASAASVAALLLLSLLYFKAANQIKYTTEYGEIKTIMLPDGSQVTLNANSSLKIKDHWESGSSREVWLEGEGFFSVKHTTLKTRFLVHTHDINVEVLGTEFNLQQRRHRTTVVLHNGKIRLTEVNKVNGTAVIMNPGDLVEFNDRTQKMVRKSVKADDYLAWKEGKMVFNNADFSEIAQVIEENYGLTVNADQVDLRGKAFNGIFPANNLQVLLAALSKAYNIDIHVHNKELIIQNLTDSLSR